MTVRLETLPTEILHAVAGLLPPWDIKHLSCTSKWLRQACLSILFRRVKFEFSQTGIKGLKGLLKSNVRSHVVSFTYEVTELLKPEILDFNCFRSDILTPDVYVDIAKDMYDMNFDADDFPSYTAIYKTVHDICEEQHSILYEGADLLLSSVFCALPRLKEVRLSFCEALEENDDCMLRDDVIIKDEFYQHHLQVVTSAIRNARSGGIAIHTICLLGFELPYFNTRVEPEPDLSALSKSLRQLLEGIKVLRLRESECVLKLLSHYALDLHQLDLCRVDATAMTLAHFLEANKKTIRSIGFHEATISKSSSRMSSHLMNASILCRMLGVPNSTPCRTDDCGCLPWQKEGSRLVIDQDQGWERN